MFLLCSFLEQIMATVKKACGLWTGQAQLGSLWRIMSEANHTPSAIADPNRVRGGFADLTDYHLAAWRENEAEVTVLVSHQHLNRSGVMHGGMLTTLIDTACGYSGCYSADPGQPLRAFTLSLTCQFISTAKAGAQLTARAVRKGGGRSIFYASCEVTDDQGRLIGQGEGVFKYITRP